MIRLLVVDDDRTTLLAVRRRLEHLRPGWSISTCDDPQSALQLIKQSVPDVIISDYQMPKMNGAELLRAVALKHPSIARIMMSSCSELGEEIESLGVAHRFVEKGVAYEALATVVERCCETRDRCFPEALEQFIRGVTGLPSTPRFFSTLREMFHRENYRQAEIENLLRQDMSIYTLLLKAANSVIYGGRSPVTNLGQALVVLGVNTVKSIVLAAELFSKIDEKTATRFNVDQLWSHSLIVAELAAESASGVESHAHLKDAAYTAGLLHDIGKLLCIHKFPNEYEQALKFSATEKIPLHQAERILFGASHEQIGGYLLSIWGIPEIVVEAVAYHHCPIDSPEDSNTVLPFVAFANLAARKQRDVDVESDETQTSRYLDLNGWFQLRQDLKETVSAESA